MKHKETARRLQEALDNKGMLPSELASKSGVSKASISQYLNGTHSPSNISSAKMADVLHVNALWLMGFDLPEPHHDIMVSSEKSKILIEAHRSLNNDGMEKLISYAQDLIASGRYKK